MITITQLIYMMVENEHVLKIILPYLSRAM